MLTIRGITMKRKLSTYDITLVGMFAALMAVGANITSWAPFLQIANVPLSMQPFFCILAGLLLGSRLGALSMTTYALIGIAGAPVFAQFHGGIGVIFGSTGGFILSYIVTAFVVGKILELSKEKAANLLNCFICWNNPYLCNWYNIHVASFKCLDECSNVI